MPNHTALRYWQMTGYSNDEITEVARELDDRTLFAIFYLSPGENVRVTLSSYLDKIKQGHGPAILTYITDVVRHWGQGSLKGAIFILLQDGVYTRLEPYTRRIPILTFCRSRTDRYSLLFPDPAFFHSKGYAKELAELRKCEKVIPWSYKKPTAYWRGSGSGKIIPTPQWKEALRVRLAMKSAKLNNSDILDAYISRVVPCNNPAYEDGLKEMNLVRDLVPLTEFTNYRYNIDVDGEFCAWKSCFLKLSIGSVLLKVESPYEQWYYPQIRPWEHYIPVSEDLSDLEDAIEWARSHDDECRQIADASTQVMAGVTHAEEALNTGTLIRDLLACQRD